ncbi:hypothetical protein D3C78_1805140 [compost metagenome]
MHGIGEVLAQPLLLDLELLGNHLLHLLRLAIDPLQVRSGRLVQALQERPIADPRWTHHQSLCRH